LGEGFAAGFGEGLTAPGCAEAGLRVEDRVDRPVGATFADGAGAAAGPGMMPGASPVTSGFPSSTHLRKPPVSATTEYPFSLSRSAARALDCSAGQLQ
jgi:hypothetical protein